MYVTTAPRKELSTTPNKRKYIPKLQTAHNHQQYIYLAPPIRPIPKCILLTLSTAYAISLYTIVQTVKPTKFNDGLPTSNPNSASACSPVSMGHLPPGSLCASVHVNSTPTSEYGARFCVAYFIGERWLNASRKLGISILIMPPINTPILSTVLVKLTEKPVCVNRVLKKIPTLSPQEVMQNALKATMKKSLAVRGRPTARTLRTAKIRLVAISKGISLVR